MVMKAHHIPFIETGYFSDLMCDYLNDKKELQPFHSGLPSFENLYQQALKKSKAYSPQIRKTLCDRLRSQYSSVKMSTSVAENLQLLENENTLTVATGHQLCLMTGPLYFIYKIVSTIKLSRQLKDRYPDLDFVPIYWMATEDHDFEEISAFIFQGKKFQWNTESGGAVGKINTKSLKPLLDLFKKELGNSINANILKSLIEKSYEAGGDLSHATRIFVHSLFEAYGLLIIDGDDANLKKHFIPYLKEELQEQTCAQKVLSQIETLEKEYNPHYKPQVNPRDLHLFFLEEGKRHRLIKDERGYTWEGKEDSVSASEMMDWVEKSPEKFSPNVLLRPLYQEVILPNIAYIGGGGELAYWLELKSFFDAQKVPFPLLILRNTALVISEKNIRKINKFKLELKDLFLKRNALINKKVRQVSNIDLDLSPFKKLLESQFEALNLLIQETDASFEGAVKAQKSKQLKGIDHLEYRLLKAQKMKLKDQVERLVLLHEQLFPSGQLQERVENFSSFYLEQGDNFIEFLLETFDPLSAEFTIVEA
jgi:bacillithiol biosynthesis cysteine-adding enzyme BshC